MPWKYVRQCKFNARLMYRLYRKTCPFQIVSLLLTLLLGHTLHNGYLIKWTVCTMYALGWLISNHNCILTGDNAFHVKLETKLSSVDTSKFITNEKSVSWLKWCSCQKAKDDEHTDRHKGGHGGPLKQIHCLQRLKIQICNKYLDIKIKYYKNIKI